MSHSHRTRWLVASTLSLAALAGAYGFAAPASTPSDSITTPAPGHSPAPEHSPVPGHAPAATPQSLRTVPNVDLERYYGRWYEIARYPNFFQRGLVGVTAEYYARPDGKIDVINTGRKRRLDGPVKRSTATAWVICTTTRSKLAVQFIRPFVADYWIIDLAEDYSYAVVGQPSRDYLWILARTPTLDDETYRQICERLVPQGYDPKKLERTPQPASAP